jgi:hypothetical protein
MFQIIVLENQELFNVFQFTDHSIMDDAWSEVLNSLGAFDRYTDEGYESREEMVNDYKNTEMCTWTDGIFTAYVVDVTNRVFKNIEEMKPFLSYLNFIHNKK